MDNSEIKEPLYVDWKEISEPFNNLLIVFSNLLEREFPAKYRNIPNVRLMYMTRFRLAINTYNAVLYLCAEIPKDPHRDKTFRLAVSPLIRTLFEELMTTVFLIHDIPKYSDFLFKTVYVETKRELDFTKKYYSSKPEWATHIKDLEKRLVEIENFHLMTAAELASIKKYPSVGRMKEILLKDFPASPFLNFYEFINEWMYRELSLSSHRDIRTMAGQGVFVSKRLAKATFGENHKEILQDILEKLVAKDFFTMTTLLLAIMTELDSAFQFPSRYNTKIKLKNLWEKLSNYSGIAKDFYEHRYFVISK